MIDQNKFAQNWIADWNSHDLDEILSHYTDDFEITTPMIKMALGNDTGTLKGKQAIREYWEQALQKFPDLEFKLFNVAQGVHSVVLYYQSVMDKKAMEVMFFDDDNKIYKVIAHYSD